MTTILGVSRLKPLALAVALAGLSGQAGAAGFALIEQSASGLGNAYAGGAAAIDDASVQFFNPAALTEIEGTQTSVALHHIMPTAELQDGATGSVVTLGGAPVTGPTSGDAGVDSFVPNFYYVRDINAQTKFGLGIGVPFGLTTEYDDDWIGRYHAIKSSVMTLNINPAIGYRVNEKLSLGAGISAQYIEAELTSAIDSGSVCYGQVGQTNPALIPALCDTPGLTPANQAVDSYAKVEGDSWGYGFNLGLLYKPTEVTRIGAAYRSEVKQDLEGKADFSLSSEFAGFLSAVSSTAFTDTDVTAGVDLPAMVSVSFSHGLSPALEIMADITWTQWSSFEELRVEYDNPAQPDTVTTENWDDAFRYSAGLSYTSSPSMKWRAGLAYDESPVPDAEHRTPRIPDNDRTWVALGLTWTANANSSFDFGYAHLFVPDAKIDNTTEAAIAHNLNGTYESSVDILSAQWNYKF